MFKMRNIIYLLLIPTVYLLLFYEQSYISIEDDKMFILNESNGPGMVRSLSDTTYKADIVTVSNLVNNLIEDDWSITRYDVNNSDIDTIFEKDGAICRVYYECSTDLTLIVTPLQRVKQLHLYIDDKE